MTRIVAGTFGGRRLATPAGRDTRPTSERVREALFSTLESMLDLSDARIADLFAGSGAVGLEALSRGAGHVLFVEADPKAARVLADNVATLGARACAEVRAVRVERLLATPPGAPYDVIFADPPYALSEPDLTAILEALVGHGWLGPEAVLVVERSSRTPAPRTVPGLTFGRGRRYGETTLWYGRRS
ncbi:MAG TPA: 16S rRNA (guanine(966)-N(2))-methyltransferase RsmD [Micromonosporaceae bacterium]